MIVLVKRGQLKRVLQWSQGLFFAAALVLLGYCGFAIVDGWIFEQRESRALEQLLSATSTPRPPAIVTTGLIGRIQISRLSVSAIVFEGVSSTTLRRAVGHIPGTAFPGQRGNVGISGHRDTFFRPLRNIRRNDIITLTTLLGEYRYRVVSMKIVRPNDVGVLDPSGNQILTLVTCFPFYFVGAAPDRFIVRAERIT